MTASRVATRQDEKKPRSARSVNCVITSSTTCGCAGSILTQSPHWGIMRAILSRISIGWAKGAENRRVFAPWLPEADVGLPNAR